MFGKRLTLFTLLGFKVRIDASWPILALLITWTLATGYFPHVQSGLAQATYWWMGVAGALGLFASIIAHEFSHSVVARREGMTMKGITLFIFGGVAEMESEPPNAAAELKMALAGPIASVLLGGVFHGFGIWGRSLGWHPPFIGVIEYLAFINVALAVFNMVPAFPLDGGRVLRAVLWKRGKSLRRATLTASAIGGAFGFGLIILGVLNIVGGNLIGGIWWSVIGLFIRGASRAHLQQVTVREALKGEPVRRFMREDPVTVPSSLSLRELVDDYVYRYHFRMFPVVDNGVLDGCITVRDIKDSAREQWDTKAVSELMRHCSDENTIAPDAEALEALSIMKRGDKSSLLVAESGRLAGVVTVRDLLDFLALKIDLEGDDEDRDIANNISPRAAAEKKR